VDEYRQLVQLLLGSKASQPLTQILGMWFFFGASPDPLTAGFRDQDAANDDPGTVVGMSW